MRAICDEPKPEPINLQASEDAELKTQPSPLHAKPTGNWPPENWQPTAKRSTPNHRRLKVLRKKQGEGQNKVLKKLAAEARTFPTSTIFSSL